MASEPYKKMKHIVNKLKNFHRVQMRIYCQEQIISFSMLNREGRLSLLSIILCIFIFISWISSRVPPNSLINLFLFKKSSSDYDF